MVRKPSSTVRAKHVQGKAKRRSVNLRGIGLAFNRVFGSKAKPPAGRLSVSRTGSGYFGNWKGEKPQQGRELVFNLNALPKHRAAVERARKFKWAGLHSITHTGIWFFPKESRAVITVIQPTVDLKKAGISSKERGQYRYANVATTLACIEHCRRKGIKLFAVYPSNYQAMHQETGKMSIGIVSLYEKTLHNAADGLKLHWADISTEGNAFWRGKEKFFGGELLELQN